MQVSSHKNLFFIFLFLFAVPSTIYNQDEELELDETEELSLDEEPALELDDPAPTEKPAATIEEELVLENGSADAPPKLVAV